MTLKEVFKALMYQGLEALGRYYSSYRGYVVDVEDPDDMGRVLVKIPSITKGKDHPTWAYPKTQWGGKNYGLQWLPSKGEIVWVEFEYGDTRFPIWSFAHRTKGEKPVEFSSSKIYGFKTPKGNMVIIDDRDGVEKIVVKAINTCIIDSDKVIFKAREITIDGLIRGTPRFSIGANGSFGTVDGRLVNVTNGLITDID